MGKHDCDYDHPTQARRRLDDSSRLRTDDRLRAAGFEIFSRPGDGEPLWRRAGVIFRQSEALLRLAEARGGNELKGE